MRSIAVVTVGRSDYGIYQSILQRIDNDTRLRLRLLVSGMHLSAEFGSTVNDIVADGVEIAARIETLQPGDSAESTAKSIGHGVIGFAEVFTRQRPDLVLVLGDRFEMYSAALAALPFAIPVAHIHGGELSEGAMDDALRHSITKLSHLHFTATEAYAARVRQMGEESWRVSVSGAPSLDRLADFVPLSAADLSARVQLDVTAPFLLVTYHPVTLEQSSTEWQTRELIAALAEIALPVVVTMSNADPGGRVVADRLRAFVDATGNARWVDNLGAHAYLSLLPYADAMVGNSSSGLIEAPSFGLPVVNIGTRQQGRVRAANVIDVDNDRRSIVDGIRRAASHEFRASIAGLPNPYRGDRRAADTIVEALATVPLGDRLIRKHFRDQAERLEPVLVS